ncbi:uncharacterized protein F4807DRAFT_463518 [Annulohypoxylon truncatum]|uniref:uncharacterized protein n=1 Tax=Annulohypoxylon truncatum TaxID=327061 RepID=UPI0020089DA1|nr:uncharacterized protein F4807DRAFT_463518 [Annulohypoxylon truncatum]KAI1206572.1 hypothetical protein F4807DRAFT_463518 [Annulohypoxylon truncatum]
MPRWFTKIKKFFKKNKRTELQEYIHIENQDVNATMSKPEKYKTPAEKGVSVPGVAQTTERSPYTMPYSGKGAVRDEQGNWWSEAAVPLTAVTRSHAAPPLYIVDNKKDNGAGAAKRSKDGNGQEAGKEPQRFHQMYPGVYTRQGPNKN